MTETRDCTQCKGSGMSEAYKCGDYTFPARKCYSCDGKGKFEPLDVPAILAAIKGRKGLRSARPKHDNHRAYYVWRLARFHGGADVTMPMGAMMDVRGDPFHVELDALVDKVAKQVFGTDLAAAHRWGRAMGHLDRDMPGLSDSAYSCGRVADADKPIEEQAEMF